MAQKTMAQKTTVALEDLTGGPAEETVRLAFDGTEYETDRNAKNAAALRKQARGQYRARPRGRADRGQPAALG